MMRAIVPLLEFLSSECDPHADPAGVAQGLARAAQAGYLAPPNGDRPGHSVLMVSQSPPMAMAVSQRSD